MFHPYKFKSPRILRRADHVSCDTCYVKEVICVDKTGTGSIHGMLAGIIVQLITYRKSAQSGN